jgi:hypothetical protein
MVTMLPRDFLKGASFTMSTTPAEPGVGRWRLTLGVPHEHVDAWQRQVEACGMRVLHVTCSLTVDGHDDTIVAYCNRATKERWDRDYVRVTYDKRHSRWKADRVVTPDDLPLVQQAWREER